MSLKKLRAYCPIFALFLGFFISASAETLFTETFDDGNGSTRWTSVTDGAADSLSDFSFDYGTLLGIPPAPNSAGTTIGMALTANRTIGSMGGISATPDDFNLYGDFTLTFDAWLNYRGPLGSMLPESLRFASFGYGSNGEETEWTGNLAPGAVLFGMSNNGSVPDDFRMIRNSTDVMDAEFVAASRDHTVDLYQSMFPSQTAPLLQDSLDPVSQSGATQAGEAGFAWHQVEVRKQGGTLTWSINGTTILEKDSTGTITEGHKIFFGISDPMGMPQAGSYPDFNAFIVDNVVVEALADTRTVVDSFHLQLTKLAKVNPSLGLGQGIFSPDILVGGANDASQGHNVPITVLSSIGFDNTSTEGELRLETDLTSWNSDNTMDDPQGVHFRFTIHADGESANPGGNGHLNGSYKGRLSVDGIVAPETYPTIEEGEAVTFSIRDIETLVATPGYAVRFGAFMGQSFSELRPEIVVSSPVPQTLKMEWEDADTGDNIIGTSGAQGLILMFEIVENVSEAEVELHADEIACEQGATAELSGFAQLVPGASPTILQNWEVATDTPEFFTVQPAIDLAGTLSFTATAGLPTTGSLRIRALDDTGFTPWTTVDLQSVDRDLTGTLPLHPDTFDSLGNFFVNDDQTAIIDTTTGMITDGTSFLPIMTSAKLLVEKDGSTWRVFCSDHVVFSTTSTIAPITGQYGFAIIATGSLSLYSSLSFNGGDGVNGFDGMEGSDAGDGTAGSDGGNIALIANRAVNTRGTISVNGGHGGDGGDAHEDPLFPGNGGAGGHGGRIIISSYTSGEIAPLYAAGGNGGSGGIAIGGTGQDPGSDGPGGNGGSIVIATNGPAFVFNTYTDAGTGSPAGGAGQEFLTTGAYFLGPMAGFRRRYVMAIDGSDDDADWSGDGISNLQYYIMELGDPSIKAPTEDVIARLPQIAITPTGHTLSYVLPNDDKHLSYEVTQSTNLKDWTVPDELETTASTEYFTEGSKLRTITWTDPADSTRFYRLNIKDTSLNVLNP